MEIDQTNEMMCLAYANYLTLLCDIQRKLNKLLGIVEIYCSTKTLCVNRSKSKILIFHDRRLSYEYCYLGTMIIDSGLFTLNLAKKNSSTQMAIGSVQDIPIATRTDFWDTRYQLFGALITSLLFYDFYDDM